MKTNNMVKKTMHNKHKYSANKGIVLSFFITWIILLIVFYNVLDVPIVIIFLLSITGNWFLTYLMLKWEVKKNKSQYYSSKQKTSIPFQNNYLQILNTHETYPYYIKISVIFPFLCVCIVFISKLVPFSRGFFEALFPYSLLIALYSILFFIIFSMAYLINFMRKKLYDNLYDDLKVTKPKLISCSEKRQYSQQQYLSIQHEITPEILQLNKKFKWALMYSGIDEHLNDKDFIHNVLNEGTYQQYIQQYIESITDSDIQIALGTLLHPQDISPPNRYFLFIVFLVKRKYINLLNHDQFQLLSHLSQLFFYIVLLEVQGKINAEQVENLHEPQKLCLHHIRFSIQAYTSYQDIKYDIKQRFQATQKSTTLDINKHITTLLKSLHAKHAKDFLEHYPTPILQFNHKPEPQTDAYRSELYELYQNLKSEIFFNAVNNFQLISDLYKLISHKMTTLSDEDKHIAENVRTKSLQRLKQGADVYFNIPEKERIRLNPQLKRIPKIYLHELIHETKEQLFNALENIMGAELISLQYPEDFVKPSELDLSKVNQKQEQKFDHYRAELYVLYQQIKSEIFFNAVKDIQTISEIYKYIDEQISTLAPQESSILNHAREQSLHRLDLEIRNYLSIPKDQQLKWHQQLNKSPKIYMNETIAQIKDQLLNELAALYNTELNALIDHQKFMDQKFKDDDEWQIFVPSQTPKGQYIQ